MEKDRLLPVTEVANRTGVHRQSVLRAIHNGELPHVRLGRKYLVPESALTPVVAEAAPEAPVATGRGKYPNSIFNEFLDGGQ